MKPIQFYYRVVRVDNPVVSDTIWMKAFDNTLNGATIHVISIGTIKGYQQIPITCKPYKVQEI